MLARELLLRTDLKQHASSDPVHAEKTQQELQHLLATLAALGITLQTVMQMHSAVMHRPPAAGNTMPFPASGSGTARRECYLQT